MLFHPKPKAKLKDLFSGCRIALFGPVIGKTPLPLKRDNRSSIMKWIAIIIIRFIVLPEKYQRSGWQKLSSKENHFFENLFFRFLSNPPKISSAYERNGWWIPAGRSPFKMLNSRFPGFRSGKRFSSVLSQMTKWTLLKFVFGINPSWWE